MFAHLTGFFYLKFWSRDSLMAQNNIQIFNRKPGTERHLLQLCFDLCCFTSVKCYCMPPFNHVHMLTEMINTVKPRLSGLVGTSVNSPDNRESG